MKSLLFSSLFALSMSAHATTQCQAFINYQGEGQTPEPTQMICSGKIKTSKDCKKACTTTAKKKCPRGVITFTGTYNFNSDKTGFEADSVNGKCP